MQGACTEMHLRQISMSFCMVPARLGQGMYLGLGFHYLGLGLGTIWGDPPKYQLFGVGDHWKCIFPILQNSSKMLIFCQWRKSHSFPRWKNLNTKENTLPVIIHPTIWVWVWVFGYLGTIWGAPPNTNYLGGDPKYPNTYLVNSLIIHFNSIVGSAAKVKWFNYFSVPASAVCPTLRNRSRSLSEELWLPIFFFV